MKRQTSGGYTIIEVLIVLAVSAGLFFAVILVFSGKQGRTETEQAVRDLESSIHNMISEVSNGYFPAGVRCSAGASGQPTVTAVATTGGNNEGCIFLGKIMKFDASQASVYTVVGRQFVGGIGSSSVGSLNQAQPLVMSSAINTRTYPYQMKVRKVVGITTNQEYMALSYLSSVQNSGSGNPVSGSQGVLLYGLLGNIASTLNPGSVTFANFQQLNGGAYVCIEGGNGVRGELRVGDSGNVTDTIVTMNVGASSVCAS